MASGGASRDANLREIDRRPQLRGIQGDPRPISGITQNCFAGDARLDRELVASRLAGVCQITKARLRRLEGIYAFDRTR